MSAGAGSAARARRSLTLRARLFLILLAGLALAHVLSFSALFFERYSAAREVMLDTLENDVATSVAILDRLPAAERPAWIGPLQRANYGYAIGEGRAGSNELSERAQVIAAKIRAADAAPNAASATTDSANTFLPGH